MHYELCIMHWVGSLSSHASVLHPFRHPPASALIQCFHLLLTLRTHSCTIIIIVLVFARGATFLDADAVSVFRTRNPCFCLCHNYFLSSFIVFLCVLIMFFSSIIRAFNSVTSAWSIFTALPSCKASSMALVCS